MGRNRAFFWLLAALVAAATLAPKAFAQPDAAGVLAPRFPASWRHALFIQPVLLSRYNRVDGIVQSLKIHGRAPFDNARVPLVESYGRLDVHTITLPHYRIRGGTAGVAVNLPCARLGELSGMWLRLSADYHKATVSPDDWIVGDAENTLASLLLKYDYKNYYLSEGYRTQVAAIYVPERQTMRIGMRLGWQNDLHRPLAARTEWSLVPLQRSFRSNIRAVQGRQRALRIGADISIQDTPRIPQKIAQASLQFEKAGGELGGDFEYYGIFIDMRIASITFGRTWLTLRGLVGSRTDELAPQHLLRLGGIGTLRGVPHQRLTGNRMWLISAEYHLGNVMPQIPSVLFFKSDMVRRAIALTEAGIFYDVGTAYQARAGTSVLDHWFEGRATDNWGIFLSIAKDLVRLEWATTRGVGHEYSDIVRVRVGLKP